MQRQKCKVCSIKYLCGGDCYYDSFIHTGNENIADDHFCRVYKDICNIALWLVFTMENTYPEQFKKIVHIIDYKNKITKE